MLNITVPFMPIQDSETTILNVQFYANFHRGLGAVGFEPTYSEEEGFTVSRNTIYNNTFQ